MAKKKQEDPPKGSPAWMATFSDLMNLLLCFFVLLFSMSSVDAAKFEKVVASLQSTFSVLPDGGAAVGDGDMVSAGISQLQEYDIYYNEGANSNGDDTGGVTDSDKEGSTGKIDSENQEDALAAAEAAVEKEKLEESEEMAEKIEEQAQQFGIQNQVEIDFNGRYVEIELNGALLFDSGSSDIRTEALPLVDKIAAILQSYDSNIIEIEGHTDNVPVSASSRYESNDVLSMYRALAVKNRVKSVATLDPSRIKSSGRGEDVPVADNSTPEGRAQNRRVVVKVYNSFYSDN